MDERRDLVDREELRRRIKANESAYDAWSYRNAMHLLDAMPAVECPRGWTRGEVLAELDADPDAVCEWLPMVRGDWRPMARNIVKDWENPDVPRPNVRVVRDALARDAQVREIVNTERPTGLAAYTVACCGAYVLLLRRWWRRPPTWHDTTAALKRASERSGR